MKIISHRGNLYEKNVDMENRPDYIESAITYGFDVEIDVWYKNGFYLGHDYPQYQIDWKYLTNKNFWIHIKNKEALLEIQKIPYSINYFWHESDMFTITSKGYIWSLVGTPLIKNCICVLPEIKFDGNLSECYGICTDTPFFFEKTQKIEK